MISTLQSLQNKFKTDEAFKNQFEIDTGLTIDVDALGANLLDVYYGALKDLIPAGHRRYPLYARVPFSEENFEINAETRAIKIPKDFQTNGVGVVGDHLAEVLWFKMDRFYDLTDLMTTNIHIVWHNTGNKGIDLPYVTEPFALYCDEEKIYFGWWISKEATSVAGNIEFAIEFIREEVDANTNVQEVVFSLRTLPARIAVKGGLELDVATATAENYHSIVANRAIYSESVNTLAASEPIVYLGLPQGTFDLDVNEQTGEASKNLLIRAASPDNKVIHSKRMDNEGHYLNAAGEIVETEEEAADEYTLSAANHNGEIIFQWYWNNVLIKAGEEGINDIKNKVTGSDERYHLDLIELPELAITTINEDTAVDKICQSTLVTNIPGRYNAYVGNRVLHGMGEGAIRYVMTGTTVLEEANPITVAKNNTPSFMYIEDQDNLHTLVADLDWSNVNGAISWKLNKNGTLQNEVPVVGDQIGQPIKYVIVEPGDYQLEVYNTKNNMKQTDKSDITTALHAPTAISTMSADWNPTTNKVTVLIDGGQGPNNEKTYQCRATVQLAGTGTAVAQNLPLDNTINHGTFEIDLNNRGLAAGQYFLTVYAVEITCPYDPVYTRWYRGADGRLGEEIATENFRVE